MSYKEMLFNLKRDLIELSYESLNKKYKNQEEYKSLLLIVNELLDKDKAFLIYYKKGFNNLWNMINKNRFNMETKGELRVLENELIKNFNGIDNISSSKQRQISNIYYEMQKQKRIADLTKDEELLESIAYDTYVISALKEDKLEFLDDELFIFSISYLLEVYKELFISNKEYINRVNNHLNLIKKQDQNKTTDYAVKVINQKINNTSQ